MNTLLRMLEPANDPTSVADKAIIIVVDEFDLFAQHPRQSFLYCLLDIVQGNRRKAGMGVIGISARSVSRLGSLALRTELNPSLALTPGLSFHSREARTIKVPVAGVPDGP
jgi:Cdc6-like AAA superfamily ATPase